MEGLNYVPEDLVFSFSDVTNVIYNKVLDVVQETRENTDQVEGRFIIPFFGGYGGCNDAFSGFGFLAFLLALLDLILELSMDNAAAAARNFGRNARDTSSSFLDNGFSTNSLKSHPDLETAYLACYSMHRGFLNALATSEGECAKRFLCEGAHEASSQGQLGKMIATVASENAASWLQQENRTRYEDVREGGFVGANGGSCAMSFAQCFSLPSTYRYPKVYSGYFEL